MSICDEIADVTVALDPHFPDYEFIHTCLYTKKKTAADDLTVKQIYKRLHLLQERLWSEVPDSYPSFRRTYLEDFITSVITQMEYFIFRRRKQGLKNVVEKLYGLKLMPVFNLDDEYADLLGRIKSAGSASVIEFKNRTRKVHIGSTAELKAKIKNKIKHLIKISDKALTPYFGSIRNMLDESGITIEINKSASPPCYYFHEKGNRGTAGIRFNTIFRQYYFEQFICHELIPGHHFYYAVKNHLLHTNKMDKVFCLDTYYSPENIINEGISTNIDLVLRDHIGDTLAILLKLEKFYHKVIYNCWYEALIEKKGNVISRYRKILTEELGESEQACGRTLDYFLKKEKLYTPCYPTGIGCIESFIKSAGVGYLPFLYLQHSVNSIHKLVTYINDRKCGR